MDMVCVVLGDVVLYQRREKETNSASLFFAQEGDFPGHPSLILFL